MGKSLPAIVDPLFSLLIMGDDRAIAATDILGQQVNP